jgi:hypothetical protein
VFAVCSRAVGGRFVRLGARANRARLVPDVLPQ